MVASRSEALVDKLLFEMLFRLLVPLSNRSVESRFLFMFEDELLAARPQGES